MSARVVLRSAFAAALLFPAMALAAANEEARAFSVDFSGVDVSDGAVRLASPEPWVREITQAGGRFEGSPRAWVADNSLAYGQGRLDVHVDRDKLPADLALTLIYEETPGADLVVQLADENDRILALDLFSNIITAGRDAKTDTFIISFLDYPSATRIVLRRLKGQVRIYGLVLTPVACAMPAEPCGEQELASQLGGNLTATNPLVQEANRIAAAQNRDLTWASSEVQNRVPLEKKNEIGSKALAKDGYPEFVPSPKPIEGQVLFATTGSALFFVSECMRHLNLYHPGALVDVPGSLTSADAQTYLMDDGSPVGLMSIAMSVADREKFYAKHHYLPIEVPVALDAIQVVVNAQNPVRELTIPQLDAIYGTELLAGGTKLIRAWGGAGAGGDWADQPVVVWGGTLAGGTSRIFQRLVLQGGPYRPDMRTDSAGFYMGVLIDVASNRFGIGYSNLQHKHDGVRRLALARQGGEPAFTPTAESLYNGDYPLTRFLYLYVNAASPEKIDPVVREALNLLFSREGQTIIAEYGQMPLGVEQVLKNRTTLGL